MEDVSGVQKPCFKRLEGVIKVTPDYSGGYVENPTYKQVVSGDTGHAEVVQVLFDPEIITHREILEIFFTMHDPTSLNRQGADVGPQYRSIIFYHSDEQEDTAKEFIEQMEDTNLLDLPIVTQLKPFKEFYEAEDYHRNYYQRNKNQSYSRFVIKPKFDKVEKKIRERTKNG